LKSFITVARILMAGALMAVAGAAAAQEAYPSRPIRLVVPFPPGGGADPVARTLSQKFTDMWGQPVLVDNRAGGNTIIGAEIVAKAPPDGYTLLLTTATTVSINPSLFRLPYDPNKAFDAMATVCKSAYVLVLNPSVPANNLQEFIALAKAKPGQFNYGSPGTGGTPHLGTELLSMMTGIKMQHVPYKGAAPYTTDVVSGQLQLSLNNNISMVAPLIKSGRLKPIAVTSATRMAALPQVPTFAEAGLPGFELITWYAIVGPAGTPKAIIDKMFSGVAAIQAMPDFQEFLVKDGMEPFVSSSPDQVTALIRTEAATYGKIIKALNFARRQPGESASVS